MDSIAGTRFEHIKFRRIESEYTKAGVLLFGGRTSNGRLWITTRGKNLRGKRKILSMDWSWADKYFPISAHMDVFKGGL